MIHDSAYVYDLVQMIAEVVTLSPKFGLCTVGSGGGDGVADVLNRIRVTSGAKVHARDWRPCEPSSITWCSIAADFRASSAASISLNSTRALRRRGLLSEQHRHPRLPCRQHDDRLLKPFAGTEWASVSSNVSHGRWLES